MFEAIDRWENEGGATPLMYPFQPLASKADNAQTATACHATSDRPTPADYGQTDPSTRHRSHSGQAAESDAAPPTGGADDGVNR
jgi:hypothetical protein